MALSIDTLQAAVNEYLDNNAPEYVKETLTGETENSIGRLWHVAEETIYGDDTGGKAYYLFDDEGKIVKVLADDAFFELEI